jgi:hypothetical protein
MKTLFALILWGLCVVQIHAAGTNEIYVGVLEAGGTTYTNATIIRANPAYAIVTYQEGIVRVAMSNMPAVYQTKFGYSPEIAQQFLDVENQIQKERRAAVLAKQRAYQRSAAAQTSKIQPIQITAILDAKSNNGLPLCAVDGIKGGILVDNLPDTVASFLNYYRQIQSDINNSEQNLRDFDSRVIKSQNDIVWAIERGTIPDYNLAKSNQAKILSDRQDAQNQLIALNARFEQMKQDYDSFTTILAYPSGHFYGNKPMWICTGMP